MRQPAIEISEAAVVTGESVMEGRSPNPHPLDRRGYVRRPEADGLT
jgi:hypothetical protein